MYKNILDNLDDRFIFLMNNLKFEIVKFGKGKAEGRKESFDRPKGGDF